MNDHIVITYFKGTTKKLFNVLELIILRDKMLK